MVERDAFFTEEACESRQHALNVVLRAAGCTGPLPWPHVPTVIIIHHEQQIWLPCPLWRLVHSEVGGSSASAGGARRCSCAPRASPQVSRWLFLLRIQSRSGCLRHTCTHPYESMSRNCQPVRAMHALQKFGEPLTFFRRREMRAPARAALSCCSSRRSGGLRPCEFGWAKDLAYTARTRLVNMS